MPTGSAAQRRSSFSASLVEVAVFAGILLSIVALGARRSYRTSSSFRTDAGDVQTNASGDIRLSTGGTLFEVVGRALGDEAIGDIRIVRDPRGVILEHIALSALIDGAPAHLVSDVPLATPVGPTHAVAHVVLHDQDATFDGDLSYTLNHSPPALLVALKLRSVQPHAVALVLSMPARTFVPFVAGTGLLADSGDAQGPLAVFEAKEHGAVLGATAGGIALHLGASEEARDSGLVATVTFPAGSAGQSPAVFVATGASTSQVLESAARIRGVAVRRLHGRVVGGEADVDVWGVDHEGKPLLHVRPYADGTFDAVAPVVELGFYATMAHTRASPIVPRVAVDNSELELTMLPGGEAHVKVEDVDTGQPLTARLIVHGVPPTADPNFGPDYRASGAGPLIDALRGEAMMPLPTGRYRVVATRGPEYTIDEQPIDVAPGSSHAIRLGLRHVVETVGWVGCDLHVHARPSFDSPVLPEDRVISLVAAGVEFAVPSEHNAVGHYEPALEALELTHELESVPGVEITTARPSLGHFNVFPYPGPQIPPFRRTTLGRIFTKAREGDPTRIFQVNHPRLTKSIGYFDIVGLDTKTGHTERDWRDDFDSLEVYNGADAANRARVETVLYDWLRLLELGHRYVATGDSDSHRIQYQWAGYPRTYVSLPPEQSGDLGPIDKTALIASLKAGHAFVTSGPIVEATINGQGPGNTVKTKDTVVRLHVAITAAPWIDVTDVEVLLGTTSVTRVPIPAKPRLAAAAPRDLATARANALRFERDFDVPFEGASKFVVVVVRGTRPMDDVLPYMPIQPFAFTNPIWLARP
jgi:hypothetical protein